jgi:hypothetical protein
MNRPPDLRPISQCNTKLRFETAAHWPPSLPAIAINGVVIAGFSQDLVFNHQSQDLRRSVLSPQQMQTWLDDNAASLWPKQ